MQKRHILRILFALIISLSIYLIYPLTMPLEIDIIKAETGKAETGLVETTPSNTTAGTIVACDRAQMSPSTGGQIAKLNISEGDKVKAGQFLLALWNENLVATIALAESQLEASEDNKTGACLHAEVAQRDADRQTALSKKGAATLCLAVVQQPS